MLIPANGPRDPGVFYFRNIQPNSSGVGLCYVRDGQHKISRTERPFIVLYLQDPDGAVIPGYIFDVSDFKQSGLDLTQVIHNIVEVHYEENYIPKYGLSVRLTRVGLVTNPTAVLLSTFVGSTKSADEDMRAIVLGIQSKIGVMFSFPYTLVTTRHIDYEGGQYGGLAKHYLRVLKQLEALEDAFTEPQRRELYITFALYIFSHINYLAASQKDEADITLLSQLMSMTETYAKKLKMGAQVHEVVATFFGCEPKSIYVRLVCQLSESVMRSCKEINLWKTLPLSREGNAGYGTIKRYKESEDI